MGNYLNQGNDAFKISINDDIYIDKSSIISFVAIIAIVVVSYVLAQGHTYEIVDLQNKGFFPRFDTVIYMRSQFLSKSDCRGIGKTFGFRRI